MADLVVWPATILITGGTGTFGQAFTTFLRNSFPNIRIRIFSRDEYKQSIMRARFGEQNISYLLGDVRDVERLRLAFRGVDVVVHAAALKQIPASEYDPDMFIAVNIEGSRAVVRASLDCGVQRAILISSDKACMPINLYGSTKMVAERLFTQANVYGGGHGTLFSVVRYGNVMNSRGSVLEVFRQTRAEGKPFPYTHQDMTRFWLTISEAVELVWYAVWHAEPGEILVPSLPAFSIMDLIHSMLELEGRELSLQTAEWIGIRPGEKLHESLMAPDEIERVRMPTNPPNPPYAIHPRFHDWGPKEAGRIPVSMTDRLYGRLEYTSDTWPWRLSVQDIRERLQAMGVM